MTDKFDYQQSDDREAVIDYANSLGISFSPQIGLVKLKERIALEINGEDAPPVATEEKRIKILIHKTESDTGVNNVPISVNGRTFLINRGEEVSVPESVIGVLKNAVREIFEYNDETGQMMSKEVQAYPFSVISE